MTLEEAIAQSYLAEGLPDSEMAYLAAQATVRSFEAEEALMRQNERGRELMLLMSGTARVMTHNGEYLGDLREGDLFGEIALIDRHPRSASVIGSTPGEVAEIAADRWSRLLDERPELAVVLLTNICRAVCAKLRSTTRWLDAALLRN